MRVIARIWRPVLVLALLLGAWELYVDLGGVDSSVLPAPHAIASSLFTDRGLLWSNFLVTAEEVLLGILVALLAGLGVAIAIHFSSAWRSALYPLIVASQAIPFPILAIVLVLWLGYGMLPRLLVVALVSFFPIVVATLGGLSGVDGELIKLMRTFDAPRRRTFRHVEFPSALPGLLVGAKIAVAVAVIGSVLAELFGGGDAGLGYLFQQSYAQFLMPRAYATAVILCAFAVALFGLLALAERLALPWAYQSRGER